MRDTTQFRHRLIWSRIATERSIQGCSDAEIAQVQSTWKWPLPRAYVEFLRVAGKRAGSLMRDIDIYYPTVLELRPTADWILDNWEEGKLPLPDDAFVFSMRRGEQFMFFRGNDSSDDPAIWFYFEGDGKFKVVADSIWDVIESEVRMSEDFRRDFPNSPLLPEPE